MPVAGVAGTANAVLWRALIVVVLSSDRHAAAGQTGRILAALAAVGRWVRAPALVVPAALAVTGGGLLIMGHVFGGTDATGLPRPLVSQDSHGHKAAVIYVNGYNSAYNGTRPVITGVGLPGRRAGCLLWRADLPAAADSEG